MRTIGILVLMLLGLLQAIGYIANSPAIKGVGLVTAASPLPIVFTEVKGVETFASDFYIVWQNQNNTKDSLKITSALYGKLKGPYNRRNVYGAVISYGPVLPKEKIISVLNYGLCSNKSLLKELGLSGNEKNIFIRITSKTKNDSRTWVITPNCK